MRPPHERHFALPDACIALAVAAFLILFALGARRARAPQIGPEPTRSPLAVPSSLTR